MRIAINGFGRIGRHFFRQYLQSLRSNRPPAFEVVVINDIADPEALVHLLNYDSSHGALQPTMQLDAKDGIQTPNGRVQFSQVADPSDCPWAQYQVDVVIEATGHFRAYADGLAHRQAGAGRVVMAAVPFDRADAVVVFGVNEQSLSPEDHIISAASCTTHCLAPLIAVLDREFGLEQVMMTEVHAYTSDQQLLDHAHRDWRRARSGAQNLIPTTSSSISAIQQIFPFMQGRISGYSMRVPTPNVACVDLTVELAHATDAKKIHEIFKNEACQNPAIIGYNDALLVSSDFNGRTESMIFDSTLTQPQDSAEPRKLFKLFAWYDNEIGYVNRLIDLLNCL